MPGKTDTNPTPADTSRFATTHWSLVLAAGDHSSPKHEKALSKLCQAYWFPLYVYLRRRGYTIHQERPYRRPVAGRLVEEGVTPGNSRLLRRDHMESRHDAVACASVAKPHSLLSLTGSDGYQRGGELQLGAAGT